MSISEPCVESATVTCLLPEVLCIYTTSVHTVAILYTQGVRLQTVGLSARCMFLDGPGAWCKGVSTCMPWHTVGI